MIRRALLAALLVALAAMAGAAKPCLLLDIDGTLAMSDDLYLLAFQELMKELGVANVDREWFAAHVAGKTDDDVFRKFQPAGHSAEDLLAWSRKKDALFCAKVRAHGATIVPGLGGALRAARDAGMTCIAVSNAQRGGCEAILALLRDRLDAADVISDLVVGAECARAKPSPDPYLEAMRRAGAEPGACIVFEDSRTGLKAGAACGAAAVVGVRTSMTHDDMIANGATHTIPDWTPVDAEFLNSLVARSTTALGAARNSPLKPK